MSRPLLLSLLLLALPASAGDPKDAEGAETPDPAALKAFSGVVSVLQHPRCMNCHPDGDAPLQFDTSTPHIMEIDRFSPEKGLPCTTCHFEEGLDVPGLPPAAAHWGLPPRNQQFQGRTEAALCAQLNDPETTGGRDLEALLEHVSTDALVKWGWEPGGGRTVPPLSHEDFVSAFRTWVEAGGPCPSE